MTCADFEQYLAEKPGSPADGLAPAALAHLKDCATCAEVVRWELSLREDAARTMPAGDPLEERVQNQVRTVLHADLVPVQPLPPRAATLALLLALPLGLALLHAVTMGGRGWQALSSVSALALGSFFVGVLWLAAYGLQEAINPGSQSKVNSLALLGAAALGFPALLATLFPFQPGEHFFADGARCLAGGLMVCALTVSLTYTLVRRGYSTNASRTGLFAGAIGGVAGLLALQISCPEQELAHLALWHGSVMLAALAAGYFSGRKFSLTQS